ncbi:MAG: GYD domain-containing protein [Chloroflexi bacterium]|nr:MAG: GYD domain-containing protein [Chloroflexota bacterium]TMF38442.1 MAG: GYD domain-containing protein [Chloroflexota bacterium]
MPKYLSMGTYTVDGIKGVLKEGGTGRRKAVQSAIEAMGGKLEAYYFAFGESDVVVISDVPDNVTAAALAIGIGSSGTVSLKTTVLLTPEEVDQATKKTISFRPAGR